MQFFLKISLQDVLGLHSSSVTVSHLNQCLNTYEVVQLTQVNDGFYCASACIHECTCVIIAAHTLVWKAIIFYHCDFLNFFIHFCQTNLGRPAMCFAEIWHADRKLV